jgi:beta-glucosidase
VNIFSGISDPAELLEVIKNNMVEIGLIDNSVLLLLREKFDLGLFEDPYVDPDGAEELVNNEKFREKADLALRQSIVLLRNEADALPVKPGTKIYFESLQRNTGQGESVQPNIYLSNDNKYPVEFVKTPAEADLVVLWLIPAGNALFGSTELRFRSRYQRVQSMSSM